MNYKDQIRLFQTFALTNSVSVYGEESKTAQALMIQCTKKIQECMKILAVYGEMIENIQKFLKMEYQEESEELVMTLEQKVEALKVQVNNSYVDIYNEDAMDLGELAGHTAKAVNECLKACNMLGDLLVEINDNVITYEVGSEMFIVGGDRND